jgi:hypothetical protein
MAAAPHRRKAPDLQHIIADGCLAVEAVIRVSNAVGNV